MLLRERALNALRRFALTPREQEVAVEVCCGRNNTQIGDRLEISAITVQSHLRNIFRKCKVHSRAQLVSLVMGQIVKDEGELALGPRPPPEDYS